MNFEREPFYGGVSYVDPLYPQIAVVGFYGIDQLEHECTYWELQAPAYPVEQGFWGREDAMQAAEDYILGA